MFFSCCFVGKKIVLPKSKKKNTVSKPLMFIDMWYKFDGLRLNYLRKVFPVELLLREPEVEAVEGAGDIPDLLHLDILLGDPIKYLRLSCGFFDTPVKHPRKVKLLNFPRFNFFVFNLKNNNISRIILYSGDYI